MSETSKAFRAGYIAIVGRPNVGKSTLLNRLVGQKLSITSRKPQTTRQRITGIVTRDDAQLMFVDTPGFQTRHTSALNRHMNRTVTQALADVDVILLVIEAGRFSAEDRALLALLPGERKVLLVINKTDRLADRGLLLPFITQVPANANSPKIVPVSASQKGTASTNSSRAPSAAICRSSRRSTARTRSPNRASVSSRPN